MPAGATSATSPTGRRHLRDLCRRLMDAGVTINRPPRDGRMAFVRSPDGISIELLQKGAALRAGRAVGVDAQHGRMVMGSTDRRAVPVLTDNYVWLVHDPDSGETAAVDPSVAEPVLDAAAATRLDDRRRCSNTHWHPDHTGGNAGDQGGDRMRRSPRRPEAQRVSRRRPRRSPRATA